MLRRFRLEEPESVAEAAELLGRFGESAKVMPAARSFSWR